MPLISPPNDDDTLIIPFVDEEAVGLTKEQYDYIKARLALPKIVCSKCGLTNHGGNARCANWRCKNELR